VKKKGKEKSDGKACSERKKKGIKISSCQNRKKDKPRRGKKKRKVFPSPYAERRGKNLNTNFSRGGGGQKEKRKRRHTDSFEVPIERGGGKGGDKSFQLYFRRGKRGDYRSSSLGKEKRKGKNVSPRSARGKGAAMAAATRSHPASSTRGKERIKVTRGQKKIVPPSL